MIALIRKELQSALVSPIFPVSACLFLFLTGLAFTTYMTEVSSLQLPEASMRGMIYFISMILLFICPFLSMRSLAEEKKSGTWELLKTLPLSERQIILGKYLSLLILLAFLLFLTLEYPILLTLSGEPDPWPLVLSYVGIFLLGAGFLAIGLFGSSITQHQMIAALVSFILTITLWFLSDIGGTLGEQISVISHLHNFAIGVLSLSDVLYYVIVIVLFLALSLRTRRRSLPASIALAVLIVGGGAMVYLKSHPVRWDLTQTKEFSLSPQTQETLEGLSTDVKITAIFGQGEDLDAVFIRRRVDDVLHQYASLSPHIQYRMIEPNGGSDDLDLSETLGTTPEGTVVFQSGTKRKDIYKSRLFNFSDMTDTAPPKFDGEGLFTNAILSVTRNQSKTICSLSGHGERNFDDVSAAGLSELKDFLLKNNYEVKPLALSTADSLKACNLLLIPSSARPSGSIRIEEDRLIATWAQDGGRLLYLLEPMGPALLPYTLKTLGLSSTAAVLEDPERHFVLGPQFLMPLLTDHPMVKDLQGFNPIFSGARPLYQIQPSERTGPYNFSPIAVTSEKAGSQTVGGALTRARDSTPAVVVVGDSDFLSNGYLRAPGNLDLTLNMVGWLVEEAEQVTIRPVDPQFRNISLTAGQARFIAVFCPFAYPLLVLGLGGFRWYRRHRS